MLRVLVASSLLLGACTDDNAMCADAPAAAISVGDGFDGTFEPVGEGERILLLIHGSGYYGLRVAVRTTGIAPVGAEVLAQIIVDDALMGGTNVSVDDGELLDAAPHFDLSGTIDDAELLSAPVAFLASVPPDQFINVPATLRVDVTDACGTTVSAEQAVLPWWQF